jgi:hypothetical protein
LSALIVLLALYTALGIARHSPLRLRGEKAKLDAQNFCLKENETLRQRRTGAQ